MYVTADVFGFRIQAREAEEQKAKDAENPLKSAIETYALTASDVDAFIAIFGAMDIDRTGERRFISRFRQTS